MGRILGIDLGTTNSAAAVMEKHGPVVVPNSLGERITPSVVGFTKRGEVLVGKKAKRGAVMNTGRTVFSIKRHMGTDYRARVEGKDYTPQEISAMILQKIKHDCEEYFGEEINQAVVTVPAYFTDAQRQATKDSGEIAGLHVRRIIDEPTAAALAYGLDKGEDQVLMVYDFGGGTFDVSIIEVVSGVFQVRAIHGDALLGGDDIDKRLVDFLLAEFKNAEGIDLSGDPVAMQRLKEAAEEAKIELSEVKETQILVEAVAMTEKGPLTLDVSLTRSKFEELIAEFAERTVKPMEEALEDAGLTFDQVDKILMVGGTTRIPLIQRTVKKLIQREPQRDLSPEEVVALGAAVQTLVLTDMSDDGDDLASRYGKEKPVIIHMTPFSLGVGLQADQFGPIIERNSTYPTEAKDIFTTTRDFQEAISFPIFEGENNTASENTFLGLLRIEGITPAPRGIPRIEVTFRLDSDRILVARAEDLATGQEKTVRIESTDNRLSDDEKNRMMAEARERANTMIRSKVESAAGEEAEQLIERIESLLAMGGDDEEMIQMREALEEFQGMLDSGENRDHINRKMLELSRMAAQMEAAG